MQFKDIDFLNNTISISKSVYFIGNKAEIKSTKTEKDRVVPLPDLIVQALPIGKPDEYIFSDDKIHPLANKKACTLWEEYPKETKLALTPHQLRHGYASILYWAGVPPKEAQEMLGHSTISMTLDVYTDLQKNATDKVREKLNKYTV